jgi:sugar lactone lactonase YvrE
MRLRYLLFTIPLVVAGCGSDGDDDAPPASLAPTYSLGGTISGLSTEGLVLTDGTHTLGVPVGSTSFTIPAQLASGTEYALTVQAQPQGQICSVANGIGTVVQADVANVVVTCAAEARQVAGSITGLRAPGLVLASGSDTLPIQAGATSFVMPTSVAIGSTYEVTVQQQPEGQSCAVENGLGTMGNADVTDVAVTCAAPVRRLGGTIGGLMADGLVLANGDDTLAVPAGATVFTMPGTVDFDAPYAVVVQSQPAGLACSVANGNGTMGTSDVTEVAVSCAANAYSVGGTVSGLTAPGLVLGDGSNHVALALGATRFTLPTPVAEGAGYAVSVQSQPIGLSCSVANGIGTMGTSQVGDVAVTCAPTVFTLGGSLNGVDFSGLVLANNGGDLLSVAANATTFTMPLGLPAGATYAVTVHSQPANRQCTVTQGSGTMPAAAVASVIVACAPVDQVTTFAGTASQAGGTDGTGAAASFNGPMGVARSSSGDLFVSDYTGQRIRRITPAGVVTTFAGSGSSGFADGTGTTASFWNPSDIAIDSNDNLYITDRNNFRIRKITPAGTVSTFAGSSNSGNTDGLGTSATLGFVAGLAIDSAGNLYVADLSNHGIRKITPAGLVITFAGGPPGRQDGVGIGARFTGPGGVAVDAQDNVYVADSGNHLIRKITPNGVVTTVAGTGTPGASDGPAAAASFNAPHGIEVDPQGNLYVADTSNHRIRKITPDGIVSTVAGGFPGRADGNGATARFFSPHKLTLDSNGHLIVTDTNNHTIRRVVP